MRQSRDWFPEIAALQVAFMDAWLDSDQRQRPKLWERYKRVKRIAAWLARGNRILPSDYMVILNYRNRGIGGADGEANRGPRRQ
jgi:hypothetical protein